MYCEQNNRIAGYGDDHFRSFEYQKQDVNQCTDLLQQWLASNIEDDGLIDYEKDIYFDCYEHSPDHCDLIADQKLCDMADYQYATTHSQDQLSIDDPLSNSTTYYPWISEICLSVHRRTNIFRRFLNYFNRSRKRSLPSLAEEFVRVHAGRFNHPVGFRFHMSYAKEKWLLILNNLTLVADYPIYPYPQTRIIFIRKGVSYIAR